ncbi:MAG: hypothetical protein FH753_17270 [Firmicutes bacterium]|nr:hypothetical protein [Bacillota bacterium]
MKVANLTIKGKDIKRIISILKDEKSVYYGDKPHIYKTKNLVVLMREDYYYRINSTLMAVIILKFKSDIEVDIELVVSGGKSGGLMHSLGAENSENRSIIKKITEICNENSWEIINVIPEDLKKSLTKSTLDKYKNKLLKRFK